MSIERHEYSEINDLLKSLRRSRLLSSRGIIQRDFKLDSLNIKIQEEAERSLRSSVSEIDECVSFFLTSKPIKTVFNEKNVIELDSGCGLLGIICSLLGANTVFTNPEDIIPLLKSNISLNIPKAETNVHEFLWGDDASKFCTRFFDYVMSASHILQNREDGEVEKIIKNLVEVSGNGTTLILGYRIPTHDDSLEVQFRRKLCAYFDLRNGKQVIYDTPDGEIVIIYAKRKPYASFFETYAPSSSLSSSSSSSTSQIAQDISNLSVKS